MRDRTVLSLLTARTDIKWIEQMLRHIAGVHRNSVDEIVVFIDTAPLGPAYRNRPGVGSLFELRNILNTLRAAGVVDYIRDIPNSADVRKRIYKKYFGKDLKVTHNFRGYPVFGSIYALDSINADYVIHFDSDMLVHQQKGKNWVNEGKRLLQDIQDLMFVAPLSGPPRADKKLLQGGVSYKEFATYYTIDNFTSRKYMFEKARFQKMLPIKPQYISLKRRIFQALTGKSSLWNWEIMVSSALKLGQFLRADLKSTYAWTMHTPDHGPNFVDNLETIIEKVERGWFPESQAGDYDLKLDEWI